MEDLMIAKKALDTGYTCVIAHNGLVLTSNDKEILALNNFINSNIDFNDFSLAITYIDKDIFELINKLKIKKVFSYKLSKEIKELFDELEMLYKYSELV